MTKEDFKNLVLSGSALGQYEVEELIIYVRENSIELHLAFDLTLRSFGTYNSDTFKFIDGIQLPKKIQVIEVENDPVLDDFTEDNQCSLFHNTTTSETFYAVQINGSIMKMPFISNEPTYSNEQQAAIYLAKSILSEQGLMEKANLL